MARFCGRPNDRLVRGRQLGGDRVEHRVGVAQELGADRLQVGRERCLGLGCRRELVQVQLPHAGEEVEFGIVRRRAADDDADPEHPLAEARRAGERVGAASRRADDCEPGQAEMVGERRHIGRRVGDTAAGVRVGAAVARSVIRDHPQPQLGHDAVVGGVAVEPGAGRAVV